MKEFLQSLASDELGCRFLINLADCLSDGVVPTKLAKDTLDSIAARGGSISGEAVVSLLGDLIFDDPDSYQFLGPRPKDDTSEWITVKSLADILACMKPDTEEGQAELAANFGLASFKGPHLGHKDEVGVGVARFLNDKNNNCSFPLAKRFPHPKTGTPRMAPCWCSKWPHFPGQAEWPRRPSSRLAGRLRDWLGLGHYEDGHLLFMFRARHAFHVDTLQGHRPTLFDGFDNKLYKHRCSQAVRDAVTGSTMDIEKVLAGGTMLDEDLEGGPEIVSREFWFSPDRLSCDFVGITPPLRIDPDREPSHLAMLSAGSSMTATTASILWALANASGGTS